MFRRRTPTAARSAPPPAGPSPADPSPAGAPPGGADPAAALAEAGWLLPRDLRPGGAARWSLVGTVGSPTATPVDPAGLVVGDGWSLDWWIGADDRWHLPAAEAAVRQQLVADAPVVETLLRVPGGDAVHRAYGVRSPRADGDEWVVAEVRNATAIPFAVALVLRPFVADAVGSATEITVEPVDGGTGRDVAHLVSVDGRPAVVVPRRPARVAAGSAAAGDPVAVVTAGEAGADLVAAHCPEGLASLALVFPLTHTATLRAVLPVGPCEARVAYPAVLPDAAVVASGWDAHRGPVRVEVPEPRLTAGLARASAHVQLAADGEVVRRDGHRSPAVDPGATEVILGAYDLLGRHAEVGAVLARWIDLLADASPPVDALFLTAISRHWLLHRADALLDWMLPEVAAAVERLDRAHRRGQLDGPDRRRAADALRLTGRLLAAAGQGDAGADVARLAATVAEGVAPAEVVGPVEGLLGAARLAAAGEPAGLARARTLLDAASATTTWPGPGPDGRPIGHDLAASAALVHAALALLVGDPADGDPVDGDGTAGGADRDGGPGAPGALHLVPHLPDDWYGAPLELHDAPTAHGLLSFAVRWHGLRPALLWELVPHPDAGPVLLRAPGLDPTWRTTEARGDALLAEVRPPQGLDRLRGVAEHPDIDPAMRRPGEEPPGPDGPLPEGGSFA